MKPHPKKNILKDFMGACRDAGRRLTQKSWERDLPRGDGRPVLVIPGFLSGDATVKPLRSFLDKLGYAAEPWQQGVNRGPSQKTLDGLEKRLEEVYRTHGGRKVSIVGWSLGGIYARRLAARRPDMIENVVTLGSPFKTAEKPGKKLRDAFAKINPALDPEKEFGAATEITVPLASVCGLKDSVAGVEACRLPETGKTENIEVDASHTSLLINAQALTVIADRLAQNARNWKAFDDSRYRKAFPKRGKSAKRRADLNKPAPGKPS